MISSKYDGSYLPLVLDEVVNGECLLISVVATESSLVNNPAVEAEVRVFKAFVNVLAMPKMRELLILQFPNF